ncbi:unnamed protein product [Victoria cruziana]
MSALSKPFIHLKPLTHHHPKHHRQCLHRLLPLRFLSFSTPEEAAADRRRRKRRLRIEPPANSLRHHAPRPPPSSKTGPNPNSPKLPEPVSALSGNRLNLHNRILAMLHLHHHEDAVLLVRHSIYSNCRPTIFTANSVLAYLLRHGRYADLLSLHRFVTQAGIAANVVTYNLLLQAYCDVRKVDIALETYTQMINDAPFNPSPTTYRILVKGLVDNDRVERAVELLREMQEKGYAADPVVYNLVMSGLVKNDEFDRVLEFYEELKGKTGVLDGGVYGTLMVAYFKRGMEKEAMDLYKEFLQLDYKISAVGYNSVLDALSKNGKFESEAIGLFDSMLKIHDPPKRISVNLGSFNVMIDGYCSAGRCDEAMQMFRGMGDRKCSPDTLSYNNLINQLCKNGLITEAEGFYNEMLGKESVKLDELTYVLLVDACFGAKRVEDAIGYFTKMVDAGLRPNVTAYNKLFTWLFKESKIDDVKKFFEQMVEKELKPSEETYDIMLKGLNGAGNLDEMLKIAARMLEDGTGLTGEKLDFVKDVLKAEEKESELQRLYDEQAEKERLAKEKAEREKAEKERAEREKAEREKAERERANEALARLLQSKGKPLGQAGENAEVSAAEVVPTVQAGEGATEGGDTQGVSAWTNGDTINEQAKVNV